MRDPIDDALRYRDEQEARYLARLPVCDLCDEPIQDDWFFLHPRTNEKICPNCIEEAKQWTENYVRYEDDEEF